MLLKPWGVRFCPALPTTLPGWNASRNYACWTYFWRCIDYLWDVPSRRIKSFMFIPEKGGLNLSKGFFWDWRNENNTLFIFVLLAFTQRTWHTYIHTYTHTSTRIHMPTHTHTTQTATICDKLLWPQLQETLLRRFQLPCLAWTWHTVTRPWPRMTWSLQCVQLRQGMVHLGVPCHLNQCDFLNHNDSWHGYPWIHRVFWNMNWRPHFIFSMGFLCKGLDRRHINHYTMEAFYALYKMWCEGQDMDEKEVASSRRFRDIYSQQWASTLQMRELSQHARCLLYYTIILF